MSLLGYRVPPALPALALMTAPTTERAKAQNPRSLSGLLPFLRPYRLRIALAILFLVLAAVSTLVFPIALRSLIDGGLVSGPGAAAAAPGRGASGRTVTHQLLGAETNERFFFPGGK